MRPVYMAAQAPDLKDSAVAQAIEETPLTVFDPTSFVEQALPCLEEARTQADVVVLDGLEDLEDSHAEAFARVQALFEDGPLVVAATRDRNRPWFEALRHREDTLVLEVRDDNRAVVDRDLADRLTRALQGA